MYNKYYKYKFKYLQMKLLQNGGDPSDMNSPLLIYMIGHESGSINPRGYICTVLYQIKLFMKYSGIDKFRIFLIYGDNNKGEKHTCYHPNAKDISVNDHPIPYGVDIIHIKPHHNIDTVKNIFKTILGNNTTSRTPIIFIYDGHGYTDSSINGTMILNSSINLDCENFSELFNTYKENNKLFLFTQCGSYDFQQKLQTKDIGKYTSICSTFEPNACGLGARVLIRLSVLLNMGISYFFKDFELFMPYYIHSSYNMPISSIMLNYNTKDFFKGYLYIPHNKYCNYNLDKVRQIGGLTVTTESSESSEWLFQVQPDGSNVVKIKTSKEYMYEGQKRNAYLDIYTEEMADLPLMLWSEANNKKQKFYINKDLSLSTFSNPDYFIICKNNIILQTNKSEDKQFKIIISL
jgi:hypothetical protein